MSFAVHGGGYSPGVATPSDRLLYVELHQQKPFSSIREEAYLQILRTADVVSSWIKEVLAPFEISLPQYNVLRILRGAGGSGLSNGDIAARMISDRPDISRLVAKLAARELVVRLGSGGDRRVRFSRISPAGERLLAEATPLVSRRIDERLGCLEAEQLDALSELLEAARHRWRLGG